MTVRSAHDTMDIASAQKNASGEVKKTSTRLRSPDHVFTLGLEEELQIIDPETRELRSHIQQILADGKIVLKGRSNQSCTSRLWKSAPRFAVMPETRDGKLLHFALSWPKLRRSTGW